MCLILSDRRQPQLCTLPERKSPVATIMGVLHVHRHLHALSLLLLLRGKLPAHLITVSRPNFCPTKEGSVMSIPCIGVELIEEYHDSRMDQDL